MTRATISERLIDHIRRGLDTHLTLPEACADTLGWIKQEGLVQEVFEELGVEALSHYYRQHAHAERNDALSPQPKARTNADSPASPGRRFKVEDVNAAILNLDYAVDSAGHRKCLGDMTKADCAYVAGHYRTLADTNGQMAKGFAKLAAGLTGRQTVRQRYKAEEIRKMLKVG
jgi:hypothetical protein